MLLLLTQNIQKLVKGTAWLMAVAEDVLFVPLAFSDL